MKKITKSRLIILVLSLVFILSAVTTCFAETRVLEEFENNSPDSGIEILLKEDLTINVDLNIKKDTLSISAIATTTKASGTITGSAFLEYQNGRKWEAVKSWKIRGNSTAVVSNTYRVKQHGNYRVKIKVSDGKTTVTKTSSIVEF